MKLDKDTKQIDILGKTEDSDRVIECKVDASDTAALDIRYCNFVVESTYGIRPSSGQKESAILSENLALDRNYP